MLKKILIIIVYIKHYICTSPCLFNFRHFKFRTAITTPFNSLGSIFVWKRSNNDFFRNHKSRVETKTKMPYNGISCIFVFCKKFLCSGECYLVNVFINIISIHTNTMIRYSKSPCIFIDWYNHFQITKFSFIIAERWQSLDFLCSINSIWNKFSEKNLMITI